MNIYNIKYTYVNKYMLYAYMHSGKVSITIIYLWNHNLKYNVVYIYDEHSFSNWLKNG